MERAYILRVHQEVTPAFPKRTSRKCIHHRVSGRVDLEGPVVRAKNPVRSVASEEHARVRSTRRGRSRERYKHPRDLLLLRKDANSGLLPGR